MTKSNSTAQTTGDPHVRSFREIAVAVDVAMLTIIDDALKVLVVHRASPPDAGSSALCGGMVQPRESLDEAAARVLSEKVGIENVFLEQLFSFGDPDRDPRTRVISVAYYALVHPGRLDELDARGATSMARIVVPWEGETGGPVELRDAVGAELDLAFDHADIIGMAVKRIRGKLDYVPIGFQLLPPRFTLRQLQQVHEIVMDRPFNKDSFRRRMLASGLLEATGEREEEVGHRPAELYRFAKRSAI